MITKTFMYGDHEVTLETGRLARHADSAVLVTMEDTVLLVTLVWGKQPKQGGDGLMLTVNYQEKSYAAGRIPGSFFKREGRPSEKETLTSRLIDRPLRPLFPDGFSHEVQIVATVLSMNPEMDADVPAMLGASAAIRLSGIPFGDTVGAARVGYVNEQFILNPTRKQMEQSLLDLTVAGTKDAVMMVESEAKILSEQVMLDAVFYGFKQMQDAIDAIDEFASKAGATTLEWTPPAVDTVLIDTVTKAVTEPVKEAYKIKDKATRSEKLEQIRRNIVADMLESGHSEDAVDKLFDKISKKVVRESVLQGNPRIDGRDLTTVRPIKVETNVLPRTHGSALFTRGETQALGVTTLGTDRDAQRIDAIEGEYRESFIFHYNFPPFCTGETGQMGSPKRREIGHGRLAKRGLIAVIPSQEEFPYSLRVVSEVLESNGSSSMASVCAASLSLMDAGVPIKAPVAGIAMGLIKEGDKAKVLTDILGDEDFLGDMDFKVAGTAHGVTTLQMDIKVSGISKSIMETALHQAKEARLHILQIMNKVIAEPKTEVSPYAPRIETMKIHPDKVREVIGKGGATIRALTEATGAQIDIEDDGTIKISAVDAAARDEACRRIKLITAEIEPGQIYEGKVVKIMEFGLFVNLTPNKDGLVHVSQISEKRVEDVSKLYKEGDIVRVKVMEIDKQGRIRLTIKGVDKEESNNSEE